MHPFLAHLLTNGFEPEKMTPQCLKITEKVSFNITSEASFIYIFNEQKLVKNAKNEKFKCDILDDFQTLWFWVFSLTFFWQIRRHIMIAKLCIFAGFLSLFRT